MKSFLLLIISTIFFMPHVICKEKTKYIYRYKKDQFIDLGSLGVKGRNIAPGDISIKERKRVIFNEKIYERKSFKNEIKEDFNLFFGRD